MNIVQKSRAVKLSIGLIAASAVLVPTYAQAATLYVSDGGANSIKQISSNTVRLDKYGSLCAEITHSL